MGVIMLEWICRALQLFVILAFGAACATTANDKHVLILVKPRGSVVGKLYHEAAFISNFEVVFPAEEIDRERNIGLVMANPKDVLGQITLLDPLSEFSIEGIYPSSRLTKVNLKYKQRLEPIKPAFQNEEFYQRNLIVNDSLGRRECKAILVSRRSVHISNYHCISTQEECMRSLITNETEGGEKCTKILYSDPVNDLVIFSTNHQSIDSSLASGVPIFEPSLVMTSECVTEKDHLGYPQVDALLTKEGKIRNSAVLGYCRQRIKHGDSGGMIVSEDRRFQGMIWGYINMPNGTQTVLFTTSAYIEAMFQKANIPMPISSTKLTGS